MKNPNRTDMLGVIFETDKNDAIKVDSEDSNYYLEFNKTEDYFCTYENQIKFIKETEALVKKHPFYNRYLKYLIEVVGIHTCQVLSNIEVPEIGKSRVTLEMHHGPMLTLFDICNIVLNYLRNSNYKLINTFRVSQIVLEEHRQNRVHLVRLAKTVHQQVHENIIFLNNQQGFGDVYSFLELYKTGLDRRIIRQINEYIDLSKENDSFDNDCLEIEEKLKVWDNFDLDEGIVNLKELIDKK